MHFDTIAAQQRWDALIRRQGNRGLLRQPTLADRPISVSVQMESALERIGAASNPLDRVALVSPLDPDTGEQLDPVPSEKDVIISLDPRVDGKVLLKIVAPPDSMGADVVTLYWRIKVRR